MVQVEKFSESGGLGISLEASVDRHYICSVLPEGPVGRTGKLYSGDELLEVQIPIQAINMIKTLMFIPDISDVFDCLCV